jgi:hypothetical protein
MVSTGVLLCTSSGNNKLVSKANTLVGLWDRVSTWLVLVPLVLVLGMLSFDEWDLLPTSFTAKLELLDCELAVLEATGGLDLLLETLGLKVLGSSQMSLESPPSAPVISKSKSKLAGCMGFGVANWVNVDRRGWKSGLRIWLNDWLLRRSITGDLTGESSLIISSI